MIYKDVLMLFKTGLEKINKFKNLNKALMMAL
jgi:hypothetical protein